MSQVQAKAGTANATSLVISSLSASGAGNFLVALISCSGDGENVTGVTDDQSQTWTKFTGTAINNQVCFYKANTAAGVTSVTISADTTRELGAIIIERNDVATASPEASTKNGKQNITVTSWTSNNSGTQSQAACIAFGWVIVATTGATPAPSGSWAAISGTGLTSGVIEGNGNTYYAQDQTLASTAAVAATGTTPVSRSPQVSVVVFKLASSSSPTSMTTVSFF